MNGEKKVDAARLEGADFVRAMSCVAVLGLHLAQRMDVGALPPALADIHAVAMMGAFGVGGFFVLSGFLLARPFWLALDGGRAMPSLRTFAFRRLVRIAPGFYVALTISFLLGFTVFGLSPDLTLFGRYLAGLLFISDLHWLTYFPVEFNGPLWSIGYEVSAYALLPIGFCILFALPRHRVRGPVGRVLWMCVIATAVLLHAVVARTLNIEGPDVGWAYGYLGGARLLWPDFNLFGLFALFAIGSLAAGVQTLTQGARHWLGDGLALAGLLMAGFAVWLHVPSGVSEGWGLFGLPYGFPLFPLGIGLVLAAAPSSRFFGRLTSAAPFGRIATISFGLYLWHDPVMEMVRAFIAPAYVNGGMSHLAGWAIASLIVLTASTGLAIASYLLVEQPALHWARRREHRWRQTDAADRLPVQASPAE